MVISEYTFRLRDFHPKSCKIGSDGMCDFCSHISQLDIAIQDTQRTLEKLIDERDALLRTQASRIHSPILRLPTELTLHIFAFYVESEHDSDVEEQYNYYDPAKSLYEAQQMSDRAAPLTLSAVCQRWREIALAAPTLWTTPVVQIYSKNHWQLAIQEQLLAEWLDRSADLPLEISIFRSFDPALWDVRAFIDAVRQVAPRLAKLDLNLPPAFCGDLLQLCGTFKLLEELRLHPMTSTRESLPSLFPLPHLPALKRLWSNLSLNLRFSSDLPALVVCHLNTLWAQDFLKLLRHAPNLEEGVFENLHSLTHNTMSLPGKIIHRRLKKLNIRSGNILWDPYRWMDDLSLPSLESFISNSRVCRGAAFVGVFLPFLHRSQCHLREFIFRSYPAEMSQANLLMILESIPSVTRLLLTCTDDGPTWFSDPFFQKFSQALDIAGRPVFLPHIEMLEIQTRAWDLPFSWETFLVFLEVLNSRCLAFHVDDGTQSVIHASNRGHITVSVYLLGTPEQIENIIPPEIVNQLAAYQKGPFVVLKILHSESGRDLIEESLARATKDGSVEVSL